MREGGGGVWQVIAGDHQGSFELRHWLTAIEVLVTYNWTQQRRQQQRPIDWGLQNGDEDLSLESLESECLADDDDNCALIIASCAAQLQQFAQTLSVSLPPSLSLWIKDVCQRHFWAGVNWIPVQVRWWWMGSRLWLHTGLTTSFSTVLLSHSLQPYLSLSFWLCAFDLSRWKIKVAHTFVMDNELQECNWGVALAVGVGVGVVVSITCWTIKRSAH